MNERFYASVAGYPLTAQAMKDGGRLDTPMEVYSNLGLETEEGRVVVQFDKKEGALGASGHVTPRHPFGKSGGAIFGLSLIAGRVAAGRSARLVGVPTRWNRRGKIIEGASAATLRTALDTLG